MHCITQKNNYTRNLKKKRIPDLIIILWISVKHFIFWFFFVFCISSVGIVFLSSIFFFLISFETKIQSGNSFIRTRKSITPSFLVHLYTIQFMYQWICRAGVKTNNSEILHYMYMYVEKKNPTTVYRVYTS